MSARKLQELRKRILRGQEVGDALLARLHGQTVALQAENVTAEVVASAYVKLAGVQMKWCELELAILREAARQDEQKQKSKITSDGDSTPAVEPLSEEEWQSLQSWVQQREASPLHYTSNP